MMRSIVALSFTLLLAASAGASSIADIGSWHLNADPPHAGMTGTVNSASQVTLSAAGAIPNATDIGYASVNGTSVADATQGYYFSPAEDFHIAVDYDLSFSSSLGFGGIGFGVGEDAEGSNGAGVGMVFNNGTPLGYGGSARVNDTPLAALALAVTTDPTGRFFVQYQAASGDIVVGASGTPGGLLPTFSDVFSGAAVQHQWAGDPLLVSFFLRSDTQSPIFITPLTSGTVSAVFSNFEVLSGTPLSVPEPSAVWLLIGFAVPARFRKR